MRHDGGGPWRQRLAFVCLCAMAGAVCIMSGFFGLDMDVLQMNLSPNAVTSSIHQEASTSLEDLPRAFDRLVFVVIDALRADMVLGNAAIHRNHQYGDDLSMFMPYTAQLARKDTTIAYVAQAGVPTVTMPRLKALTTGKQPAFIDVLRNFNSKALDDDNIMETFHQAGYRMVLYGDETWLALFPRLFHRHDATSGFFTTDTVFVDSNVTRHLHEELDPTMASPKSRDWDVLVLHYLGVDHVGHLEGPHSSAMRHKLAEMDAVLQSIHGAIQAQDAVRHRSNDDATKSTLSTLFVLCSDHGMTNTGNHGGASVEESSALLLFVLPPKHQPSESTRPQHSAASDETAAPPPPPPFRRALQVDLVPTLAALFGLTIPSTNTGKTLFDVITGAGVAAPLRALRRNLDQLTKSWAPADRQKLGISAQLDEAELALALERAQEIVLKSDGSEYNEVAIALGVACMAGGMAAAAMAGSQIDQIWRRPTSKRSWAPVVLAVGTVVQVASYGSSSAIENEHATWNFILTTLWVYHGLQHLAAKEFNEMPLIALLAATTRILRSRNQVINFGRLNHLPSLAALKNTTVGFEYELDDALSVFTTRSLLDNLDLPPRYETMGTAVCIGVYGIWKLEHLVGARLWRHLLQMVFLGGVVASLAFAFNQTVAAYAHATYACAAILFVSAWCLPTADPASRSASCRGFIPVEMAAWVLGLLLQREANSAVLAILSVQQACFFAWQHRRRRHNDDTSIEAAVSALWMSKCAFYTLGNSHLMTTIDISMAYTGLTTYSQGIVGFLTFFIVMTGPSLVLFASLTTIPVGDMLPTLWGLELLSCLVYSVIVYAMRFHLFVWSVFAPKMMYLLAFLVWNVAITAVAALLPSRS